jgi:hypothetical protein
MLRLLQRCNAGPPRPELAKASRAELVSFARAGRHGWPERFADRVSTALSAPSLPTRDYLVRAKAAGIRRAAVQLLALHETRRAWQQRMSELLHGDPRTGRDHSMNDPDPGKAFPGGEIYLSMPCRPAPAGQPPSGHPAWLPEDPYLLRRGHRLAPTVNEDQHFAAA